MTLGCSGLLCSSSWKFNFENSGSASLEGALTCSLGWAWREGREEGKRREKRGGGGRGRGGRGRGGRGRSCSVLDFYI